MVLCLPCQGLRRDVYCRLCFKLLTVGCTWCMVVGHRCTGRPAYSSMREELSTQHKMADISFLAVVQDIISPVIEFVAGKSIKDL